MKRSEFLKEIEDLLSDYLGSKINRPDILAELVIEEVEKHTLPKSYLCLRTNQYLRAWEPEEK
jgi:hypothetical protein